MSQNFRDNALTRQDRSPHPISFPRRQNGLSLVDDAPNVTGQSEPNWFEKTLLQINNHAKRDVISKRSVRPSWSEACFIHAIPGDDLDPGVIVLTDGSLRSVLSCRGINALLFDPDERDRLAQDLTNLANTIDFDIQIMVTSRNLPVDEYLSRYQSQLNSEDDFLRWYAHHTDCWFRAMQELNYIPLREFHVIVEYLPPDCKRLGTQKERWDGRRSSELHARFVVQLERQVRMVQDQLRNSCLEPEVLTRKQVRDLVFQHLNPQLSEETADAPRSTPLMAEASTLARSALRIHNDHLWLDGTCVATQYLKEPPHETWAGWLVELMCLNAQYTFSLFVHACNQDAVRKQLRREFKFSSIALSQLGGPPDLDSIESTTAARDAIQQLLRTSNKAVDVSLYIKTRADDLEELETRMGEIGRVFRNRGATLTSADGMQFEAWQSCLPLGVDRLAFVHKVTAPVLGTFWPFFTASCGTPDGVPLGFAVASGEPVLLNPFFLGEGKDANNMFVVGSTGAGKSFAVQMLIMRLLPLGMRFVIVDKTVDKQGAYRFITELLGPEIATYVDLGPGAGFMLNPFDLGGDEDGTMAEPSPLKVTKLLGLLDLMLVSEGREELDIEEKSLLDRLIRFTYRECARLGTVPTMSDLFQAANYACKAEQDLEQKARLVHFARGLSMYTRGSAFGGLLDGYTNVDPNRLVIVFDTRDVNDPRLERIMAYILTEFIRKRAAQSKADDVRMAAIIDEAATLMKFKAGARLLEDLSRRARHYGLMLVTITQQLKDFFRQAEIADSVVKNAHMKILLRQDPGDLQMLKDTLQLTCAEKQSLANLGSRQQKRKDSQCLLIVGASHGVIRIVPSPLDYWICTSEPTRDIPVRRKQIEWVKSTVPGITHTNACRQAIYLLGSKPRT